MKDIAIETVPAELDGLKSALTIDTRAWLREFNRFLYDFPSEDMACGIVRRHFNRVGPTGEQCRAFVEWLTSGDTDVKGRALQRVFMEDMERDDGPEPALASGTRCPEGWAAILRRWCCSL